MPGRNPCRTLPPSAPGPTHESGQTLVGYTVDAVNNSSLFSAAPAIANNGTLTFTPASSQSGMATVTAVVQDNGGTIGGGVDRSTNTFTLRVVASQFVVRDAAQLTTVLVAAAASGTTILLAGHQRLRQPHGERRLRHPAIRRGHSTRTPK